MTTPKRKAKPWAVVLNAPGGPLRTEHTSEAKAYEYVRAELAAARAGTSHVTQIRVEQWDRHASLWQLFDLIAPKEQQ